MWRNAPLPERKDLWIQRTDRLFLEFRARPLKLHGRSAESFGNVFVRSEPLEVDGVKHGEMVMGTSRGRLGLLIGLRTKGEVLRELRFAGMSRRILSGRVGIQ